MSLLGSRGGVGIEISQDTLRIARLRQKGGGQVQLLDSVKLPPGLVNESFGVPNISVQSDLSGIIRNLMKSRGIKYRGVGVALPDFVSRVVVLDFETMPKKAEETEAVISLRLKRLIPFDVGQAEVRYQYLGDFREGESQLHRFLVTLIKKSVLTQYENCLMEAGLRPNNIGVSSLMIWNLYHDSIVADAGERRNYAMLNVSGRRMSVVVFERGVVRFFRLKDLGLSVIGEDTAPDIPKLVLRELGASLTFYKENYSSTPVELVFAGCPQDTYMGLMSELAPNQGLDIRPLDLTGVLSGADSRNVPKSELYLYNAACAAALEK